MADFLTDNFTDDDDTPLESHGSWTRISGTDSLEITSNACNPDSSAGWSPYYNSADQADSADYDVSVTYRVANTANVGIYVGGRIASATGYGYYFRFASGSWILITRGSSASTIGTYTGDVPTTAVTAKLQMRGTTIKVFIDGVERISVTDSTYADKGYVGLAQGYSTAATSIWVDDLVASDPAASGLSIPIAKSYYDQQQ